MCHERGEKDMKPAFKQLLQIGIIVRDVDASVKHYEELGIGPWEISYLSNDKEPFEDLTIDGKPLPFKGNLLKTAFLQRYGMEIELIEPIAESVYKKWLDEHGPGIHHLAFATEDAYEDVLTKCKEKTGKDPWIRGQGVNGLMDFSYLDLREELGLIVECYKHMQPNKPALDYNQK